MDIRNDYANCLTNLACSVRRYFGLPRRHATLSDVDRLLDEFQPNNVVVLLFNGMGSNLIDRHLVDMPNAFLVSHRLRSVTSVFPATTVVAALFSDSVLTVPQSRRDTNQFVDPSSTAMRSIRQHVS